MQLKDHHHWGDGSLADVILRRRAIPIVPESERNGWCVSEVEAILGSSSRFRPESRRPGKVRSCWGSSTIALSYHAWAFNRECFDNLNQPSLWMSFALCHRPCAILSSKPYDKVYFFSISCIDQNWISAISHMWQLFQYSSFSEASRMVIPASLVTLIIFTLHNFHLSLVHISPFLYF